MDIGTGRDAICTSTAPEGAGVVVVPVVAAAAIIKPNDGYRDGTGRDAICTSTAPEGAGAAGVIVVPVVAAVAIIKPSGWIPGRDET